MFGQLAVFENQRIASFLHAFSNAFFKRFFYKLSATFLQAFLQTLHKLGLCEVLLDKRHNAAPVF